MVSNRITVESDVPQCSRVTWHADGQPHTTVVTDRKETEEWLGQSTNVDLDVAACQICYDDLLAKNAGDSKTFLNEGIEGAWRCSGSTRYVNGAVAHGEGTTIFSTADGRHYSWSSRESGFYVLPDGTRRSATENTQGRAELNGTELQMWFENLDFMVDGKSVRTRRVGIIWIVSGDQMTLKSVSGNPSVDRAEATCTR
jgi:hypothetical protein